MNEQKSMLTNLDFGSCDRITQTKHGLAKLVPDMSSIWFSLVVPVIKACKFYV